MEIWESENPELLDFAPWDLGSENRISSGLPPSRTTVSESGIEIEGAHTNFSRSILPLMSTNHACGCLNGFGV